MIQPANAKVFVEYTQNGFKVKVLPGFFRDMVGVHAYTLVASYLNFPTIVTQTPFVVNFTDIGCQLPPTAQITIPTLNYVVGSPALAHPIFYPMSDVCGKLVAVNTNTKWLSFSPIMGGQINAVISTLDGIFVGLHNVQFKLCRAENLSLCFTTMFSVQINSSCFETLAGLQVPAITASLQDTEIKLLQLIPPMEVNPGSCGEFIYTIEPNPHFFFLDSIKHQVGFLGNLPGIVSPPHPGSTQYTLTAHYPKFPSISKSVTFTVEVIDECLQLPILDTIINVPYISYKLGQPPLSLSYEIYNGVDPCGGFIL